MKTAKVTMNNATQRALRCLKMSLPLIGGMGNIPKKEPITHIDNPASPMAGYPAVIRTKKNPAKAKLMRISKTAAMAPKCSVYFLE